MSTVYFVPDDPGYDVLAWHVTTVEIHTEDSTVTDNPVEDGSIVSDHVIHAPAVFSWEALISETPHTQDFYASLDDLEETVTVPVVVFPGIVTPSTITLKGLGRADKAAKSLVAEMMDRITAIRVGAITGTILTSARTYENMLIVHAEMPRDALSLGQGSFKLDARQIVKVATETVAAPKPKEPRGEKLKADGTKAKKEAAEGSKAMLKSWAAEGLDAFKASI